MTCVAAVSVVRSCDRQCFAPTNQQAFSAFIWSVADLLRGDDKQSEYGRVVLPFTVLRRLDCVLADTKAEVLVEQSLGRRR